MRTERKQSLESNIKRSKSMKGRKKSEDIKRKISNSMKRYWKTIPYSNKEIEKYNENEENKE